MKIGISSWSCPWAVGVPGSPAPSHPLRAMDLLEVASEESAEVLQIADNLPLDTLTPQELRELAGAAGERSILLEAGTKGLNPANLLRYLEIAQILGAKLVRTLPHDGSDRPDLQEALRRLASVKREYEAAGVTLAIENHDHYLCAWLKSLVEEADSPAVGVCLDAANNLGRGESFREALACLGGLTVNFHCKDFTIARKPTQLGFDITGCPAGEGMADLAMARRALPDGVNWIIESWLPWQGDVESTVKMERQWLDRGMHNLIAFRG